MELQRNHKQVIPTTLTTRTQCCFYPWANVLFLFSMSAKNHPQFNSSLKNLPSFIIIISHHSGHWVGLTMWFSLRVSKEVAAQFQPESPSSLPHSQWWRLMLAVSWNTYQWPLHVARNSSHYGVTEPRESLLRDSEAEVVPPRYI